MALPDKVTPSSTNILSLIEESPSLHSLWPSILGRSSHSTEYTPRNYARCADRLAQYSPYPKVVLFMEYVPLSIQRIQSSIMSVYAPALENVLSGLADDNLSSLGHSDASPSRG
jgi:hypothetical protein